MSDSEIEAVSGDKTELDSLAAFLDTVRLGETYKYTVPSFSVISVELQHPVINGLDEVK